MKKFLIWICCALSLTACSMGGEHADLRQWMDDASKGLRGKVAPLPAVKTSEPVSYEVGKLIDPFKATRVIPEKVSKGVNGPDITREREPLEAYPLESLNYVGIIMRRNVPYAIVRADQALHQVKVGNHLGQNFGEITRIGETEMVLHEFVQDGAGEWTERDSSLLLQGKE